MASDGREPFCVKVFSAFLREHGALQFDWSRPPQDPPDYYLKLGSEVFAVEVTSTDVQCEVSIGHGQICEETYHHSHTRFVNKIEQDACLARILRGQYVVGFSRPLTNSRFEKVKQWVADELLAYIKNTKDLDEVAQSCIRYQDEVVCDITKVSSRSNGVCEAFEDWAWLESPEMADQIRGLLGNAADTKRRKLETKGEVAPKILLLLNTYDFATPEKFRDCSDRIASLSYFHTVFIVWKDECGFIVRTENAQWVGGRVDRPEPHQ